MMKEKQQPDNGFFTAEVTERLSAEDHTKVIVEWIGSSQRQPDELEFKKAARRAIEADLIAQALLNIKKQDSELRVKPHASRWLVGWLPLPKARKSLRKILADQEAEIADLRAKGQDRAANWQSVWTWPLLIVSLCWRPVGVLVRLMRKLSS